MNYKSSTNFATTTFTFFSFCKNLRFFHVAKICVARVSLLPGRATQVGRGHVCTVLLLVSASAELAHAPHSNHRSTSKRYPPTEVSRNVPDETSTSAETGGVSAPEVSVPLVSASAESAHAPHSSPARTNREQRTRLHLPDEDCRGLTQTQRESNRARTACGAFPCLFHWETQELHPAPPRRHTKFLRFPMEKTTKGTGIRSRRRSRSSVLPKSRENHKPSAKHKPSTSPAQAQAQAQPQAPRRQSDVR